MELSLFTQDPWKLQSWPKMKHGAEENQSFDGLTSHYGNNVATPFESSMMCYDGPSKDSSAANPFESSVIYFDGPNTAASKMSPCYIAAPMPQLEALLTKDLQLALGKDPLWDNNVNLQALGEQPPHDGYAQDIQAQGWLDEQSYQPTPLDVPMPKFGAPPQGPQVVKVDMAVQMGETGMYCEPCVTHTASDDIASTVSDEVEPPPLPYGSDTASHLAIPGGTNSVPSIGSIGHPHSCAEACKYFKKAWGCKRGAQCNHCHLCSRHHLSKWRRPKSGAKQKPAIVYVQPISHGPPEMRDAMVDTQELEFISAHTGAAKSLGSSGHPYRCAPACRYVWRKGGCKNGEKCYCCHLCHWVRLP
jgi:hypothetical protein